MKSLTDQTEPDLAISATSQVSEPIPPNAMPGPIFLMVNSLETGGTERQFVEISRALQSRGVSVHLGCLLKRGGFVGELDELGEFDLGGSLYGLKSLRKRWQLARHLRSLGIRAAHAFDFYANLTLIPAAKLAGIPVIGSHRQLGDLLTPMQFRAQIAAFRFCDRVVCNSHAAAERLFQAGIREDKVVIVGNALPEAAFASVAPALPRRDRAFRIGLIARMNAEYKNHRGFLRVAKRLVERFPNLEFVLVGDGPLRTELERETAAFGIHEQVRFLGDRRDIPAVLRSLDLSVIPSTSESLSNVMLESMAAGVPVVATAVGGNVELGGDDRALLVPAGNDDELAKAVARAIENDGLRSRMAVRAQDFVRSHFSVEHISAQYEELYRRVIGQQADATHTSSVADVSRPRVGSRIRVALVAPSLGYVGGQAVQADLLLRHWSGDSQIVATFVPVDPEFPLGLRWASRVPFLRTVLRQPFYIWKLWKNLRHADVVHIFSASYTSFLLAPLPAWMVAKALRKKTLINYRSGEARDHLQRSPIARHVLSNANMLVVPSGYLVDVFREFGLQAQVVPNIIDLPQFRYRRRIPLRPHLICTRGFHLYYGIDVVVRAFAEVQKIYPEAKLDLAGRGDLENNIRDLVKLLHLSNVNFLGAVGRRDIGRVYDAADIFVNASNLDNMPVSVLEAFAAGTPVATTEPAGMNYIVTHDRTGLLSPPGDAPGLAQNILRILQEPGLAARLAENALEESHRYHWAAVRDQWQTIYAGLTSDDRRSESAAGTGL